MLSFTDLATTVGIADAYHDRLGHVDWTGTDGVKTAALNRGQSFIAGRFNERWAVNFDNDDAPLEVQYAIAEAARRELASPGSLAPDVTPGSVKKSVAVSGAVSVTYAVGNDVAASMQPMIAVIDGLLAGLIKAKTGTSVSVLARF